jgi:hypothetical protein
MFVCIDMYGGDVMVQKIVVMKVSQVIPLSPFLEWLSKYLRGN